MIEVTQKMLLDLIKKFSQKVENISEDIKRVTKCVHLIGEQNYQLKLVINELASEHRRNSDDLCEAMGTIRESTWF